MIMRYMRITVLMDRNHTKIIRSTPIWYWRLDTILFFYIIREIFKLLWLKQSTRRNAIFCSVMFTYLVSLFKKDIYQLCFWYDYKFSFLLSYYVIFLHSMAVYLASKLFFLPEYVIFFLWHFFKVFVVFLILFEISPLILVKSNRL